MMDEAELFKACEKYNNFVWKNSKQGDLKKYKFVNADGKISFIHVTIDRHMRRHDAIRIDEKTMEQLLEDQLTDEE